MTHEKKHSTLPLSPPEVYNKDLESLVEVLQDKLEGAIIREDYLKDRIEEMKKRVYTASVYTRMSTSDSKPLPYTLGFYSTLEEAEKYIEKEIQLRQESAHVTDYFYLRDHIHIEKIQADLVIASWGIDSISLGVELHRDGVLFHHKRYRTDGTIIT